MKGFFKYLLDPSVVALLIGGTITSVFGLMASISKNEKPKKWITLGSFFAGLIVLVSGIYAGYQNQLATSVIHNQGVKIAELSQKNAELSEKIAGSITGGESYCYIDFTLREKNIVDLMIISEGEFPLYDVEVQIHDLSKRIDNFKNNKKNLVGNDFINLLMSSANIVKVGNIGPNQGYPVGMLTLPNDVDMANYEIDIFARNGRAMQFVQYRKLNEEWIKAAEKILFHNKTIKKYIDKKFSKDQESESFLE